MASTPMRTGIKVAAAVAAFSFLTNLFRAYLGWSNGYIPGVGLSTWFEFWLIHVLLTVIFALIIFGFGFVFQLVRNRFSKQTDLGK